MNFERIIGKIEAELIAKATAKLSGAFLELALRPDNIHVGQGLGGDPLLFALLQPMQHVATLNIPTAATDGKRYYWNPKFIMKLSPIGLRLVCGHEAWHAIYMHPQRRGERIPKLWNICVDFIVNNLLMEDISFRKLDPKNTFVQHLGHYLDVDQYTEMLKNPFEPIKGFDKYFLDASNQAPNLTLPKADDERELTDEEKKEIERLGKRVTLFYADPIIPDNLKKPENLYDYFYKLLPKCPECGKPGMYKVPKENKGPTPPAKKSEDLEDSEEESETSNSEENHEEHNHAEEQKPSHEGQDALDQPGTQKGKVRVKDAVRAVLAPMVKVPEALTAMVKEKEINMLISLTSAAPLTIIWMQKNLQKKWGRDLPMRLKQLKGWQDTFQPDYKMSWANLPLRL